MEARTFTANRGQIQFFRDARPVSQVTAPFDVTWKCRLNAFRWSFLRRIINFFTTAARRNRFSKTFGQRWTAESHGHFVGFSEKQCLQFMELDVWNQTGFDVSQINSIHSTPVYFLFNQFYDRFASTESGIGL